jgi:hypothetical protein
MPNQTPDDAVVITMTGPELKVLQAMIGRNWRERDLLERLIRNSQFLTLEWLDKKREEFP